MTKADLNLIETLDLAISREQDAYFFYLDLLETTTNKEAKDTLQWIANEELKHRRFLVDYRAGKHGKKALTTSTVINYKIAEYVAAPEVSDKPLATSEIFLVAAHREKASNAFYTELANMHSDPDLKKMLLAMASEELKHKEKVEYLYSNSAFAQTAGG